ncbi:RimK family alpha-L-glutamate ligase [Kitasatospora sp. DSM 101779]|uniref:ATP-grasp domain-containing protein n=1 Tax=Kitasatospora sp. DSM 101779 TaxID=2853165 RepID=UPI0021D89DA7|nr:alpha-L-glutamate ligase [Kitasatospora sp. DSM 101779]MCU7826166.1 alpha-L-glutamate ligase [Kitasatospora sp. DSM 101779]
MSARAHVRLLTADPEHPLLAATAALLRAEGHTVDSQHPDGPERAGRPDVCLLKARTPQALALAGRLEERGVPVLNPVAATAFCQDRQRMADLALAAGLPFAPTRTVDLADLAERAVDEPVVVKSLHSRRGDLVAAVRDTATARRLAELWPGEPVVVQPLARNDGWDHKLWAVDGRLFAERRRSELAAPAAVAREELPVAAVPDGWPELVRTAGEVFGLQVYGVDILDTPDGPLIVDVNAFPGIRGQEGAPGALAALATAAAAGRRLSGTRAA